MGMMSVLGGEGHTRWTKSQERNELLVAQKDYEAIYLSPSCSVKLSRVLCKILFPGFIVPSCVCVCVCVCVREKLC
jgi:hypothetical protein